MTAIEQIHNWSNFSWWEWDGFYLWPKWSYRAWKNIDTRILENWVKVCTKFTSTEDEYNWSIVEINPFANKSFSTEVWDNWEIYEWWNYKFSLESSTSAYNKIRWFGRLTLTSDNTTYVYWFSSTSFGVWKIYRIATDYTSATEVTSFSLALWRTAVYDYISVLSLPWRIIFWCWNIIYELSNTEILTELISFPKEADIISISYYLNKYKIYYNLSKYTSWPKDWFLNYWDGSSSAVDYFVKYENSWIINVINDGAYDYVVFWDTNTSDLYLMSWLNRQELRINTEWSSFNNTRSLWRKWTIREWILYIMWENKLWEDCLYSYWNYYPWTPKSLMPENSWQSFDKIYSDVNNLYGYIDDVTEFWNWVIYSKSFLYDWDEEDSWTIYSYAITWNYWGYTFKSIKEIDVFYTLLSSSKYIKIYIKTTWWPNANNTTGRTLIKTINNTLVRWIKIYSSELTALWIWIFNQFEYKVELGSWALLYQIRTVYNDNIK